LDGSLSHIPKLILTAGGTSQVISLGQEITIGRGYSNLVRLDGDEISRVHAIIYHHGNQYVIRDLDSKNGVFLNGNKVSMGELRPGDRIQIGQYCLLYDPPAGMLNVAAGAGGAGPAHFEELQPTSMTPSVDAHPTPPGGPGGADAAHSPAVASPAPAGDSFEQSQIFAPRTSGSSGVRAGGRNVPREEIIFRTREELQEELIPRTPHADAGAEAGNNDGSRAGLEAAALRLLLELSVGLPSGTPFADHFVQALGRAFGATRAAVIVQQTGANGGHPGLAPVAIFPRNSDVAVNRVVLREAFGPARAVLCPDTRECGLFRESAAVSRDKISTLLSIPLSGPAGETGVLYVDRQGESDPFNDEHLFAAAGLARLLEASLFSSIELENTAH